MALPKGLISHLYQSGKSMSEIAKQLQCSVHTVSYWMEKYKIKRRNHSEATYLKENPTGDPFTIKKHLNRQELLLNGLAIGIYLGEGNKVINQGLRITNTDPFILRLFLRFLTTICNFNTDRISASIVCFNDSDPEAARLYWARQLKISPEKFGKITKIPRQGKGTYRKRSRYGVCSIQANSTKLTALFRDRISKLNNKAWIV